MVLLRTVSAAPTVLVDTQSHLESSIMLVGTMELQGDIHFLAIAQLLCTFEPSVLPEPTCEPVLLEPTFEPGVVGETTSEPS
jgi:hypothetical protein